MLETNGIDISESQRADSQKNLVLQRRLLYYAHHPQFINHRINQLERETSLEKIIENSSIALSLTGIVLAFVSNRRWLVLALLASGLFFLKKEPKDNQLQQLLQQQGYRSEKEIQREQQILQALRGDYDAIGASDQLPEDRVRQIVNSLNV
ncbi:hypothetical protein [Tunicatimonas pelagia]|uniref:hypothetical protein n=1 Tax=Tunicatimonas pelagia TaxID=931531 RepID=UPI00266541D4|nr:hypothetical protein [Tunicatimonas pelagia]WKN42543.1 hypothetical protein P0M28_26255 [Tunicatimonas pelagia]